MSKSKTNIVVPFEISLIFGDYWERINLQSRTEMISTWKIIWKTIDPKDNFTSKISPFLTDYLQSWNLNLAGIVTDFILEELQDEKRPYYKYIALGEVLFILNYIAQLKAYAVLHMRVRTGYTHRCQFGIATLNKLERAVYFSRYGVKKS